VSGNQALKRIFPCEVIGPDDPRIPGLDRPVGEGDRIGVGPARLEVLETPGHGKSDLSFFLAAAPGEDHGAVWTGDTMFVGGCGRLFECGPSTMWTSLQKLSALPGNTHVYCGHEYTKENYEFAVTVVPDDGEVRNRLREVEGQLQKGEFTVPSTMAKEVKTNLFLRAGEPAVQRALGVPGGSTVEAFAELRRRKDVF
jgi:hydroxyacylglutathione hydrolase